MPEDFALLVGISAYPLTTYPKLTGPPHDVELVRDWLISPEGGNVPANNVLVKLSPDPDQATNEEYPPTPNHIWAELKKVIFPNGAIAHRPDSRLYLYFSGHGFSAATPLGERQAAVYAGNAAPYMSFNVCGTTMARWCHDAGVFGEIVLVMDCCRDREYAKLAGEPQFDPIDDATRAAAVRRFEIYAVPYGEKAQERFFPQLNKTVGVLTYAFIEALKNSPGKNGARSANDIKEFMEGAWGTLVGDDRIEVPYFVTRGAGNIVFPAAVPPTTVGRVRFTPPLAGAGDLLISDHAGTPVLRVALVPGQQVVFDLVNGGAGVPSAFAGDAVNVQLPVGVYKLALLRTGLPEVTQLWNLLGGADADLKL